MIKRFWQNNSTPTLCIKLGLTAVAMFVFALFIMPPMYDLFCEVTGLNGKTGERYTQAVNAEELDNSRIIKVRFLAANNEYMPWEFRPTVTSVLVHPGEPTDIRYFAKNNTGHDMTAQAIPSLTPSDVARYFHKTECFCFNQQPLIAGESAELGLSFIVDPDIPANVKTITLMYTLFDVTQHPKTSVINMSTLEYVQLATLE
jgi:cytochrome c oxidase assembly protein subunit 11